jgi:SAM-dependent methyltransferase
MESNWWENFFHGVALDFWRLVISDEQTRAEATFISKHLQPSDGAKLLDVPCGNGRLSVELASRGFQMTGIDIASEFIDEAKANSTKRGLDIEWLQGDMRTISWSQDFDGAFCFGNSFGYLADEDNANFLRSISKALRPGARFILDAPAIAECLLPNLKEEREMEVGGITFKADSRYDHDQGRMFTEYTFVRDGVEDKRPSSQRIYTYRELKDLLHKANLEVLHAYSSLEEEPFKLGSQRLLLVCKKP